MVWIWITIAAALVALAVLHFRWRSRFEAFRRRAGLDLEAARQSSERELQELRAQQEALLNSMAEGLVILDDKDQVQLANKAFLELFQPPADPMGKTLIEVLRLHELQKTVDLLRQGQSYVSGELKMPDDRWLQVSGAVIQTPGGAQGCVLLFHDLTQIKRLQRTREEFVANVSHELRTPLSLIKGAAETLLDGARTDEQAAEKFLRMIDRNSERLRLLIEDLLAVSELESGRVKLNLATTNLRTLVAKVVAEFSPRAREVRMHLENAVPDMQLPADPDRLEQVFSNLLDNALKYGKKGNNDGHITITARQTEDGLILAEVRDDGPGIPPEALDRVFERFYRVDKARSREQGGTGLGLAIVKHIVQSHGGKVWAESRPGHGAAFFLTLPLHPHPASKVEARQAETTDSMH